MFGLRWPLWLQRNYVSRFSGKKTKRKGELKAFGETAGGVMPINDDGTVDYTLEELSAMTIQCAWCKGAIFIGEPITLYTPRKSEFAIPEHAVLFQKEPLQLVGCLRWNCAESGADRAGFWFPDPDHPFHGHVYRVLSPIEQCLSLDDVVIVGDVRDPQEAVPFPSQEETKN